MTKISWTEQTWNPIVGCSVVSPGCTNCYAMKMASRLEAMGTVPHYNGTTRKVNGKAVWTGKVAMAPDSVLMKPLKRRKPTMYFVNSMGDLFHESVPNEWIDRVFAVMALCPQHTFQILTKQPDRMQDYIEDWISWGKWVSNHEPLQRILARIYAPIREALSGVDVDYQKPLANVWLGVSVEDQRRAIERIPFLVDTPAAVRFVSVEPQLEFIDFRPKCVDWVIQGCESGHGRRPFNLNWARSMRDQCELGNVPYFLKQIPGPDGKIIKDKPLLDGVSHQAMPEVS